MPRFSFPPGVLALRDCDFCQLQPKLLTLPLTFSNHCNAFSGKLYFFASPSKS